MSTMATRPLEFAAGAGVWAHPAAAIATTRARLAAAHHAAVRRIIPCLLN
jgi:hypothetical protein